MVIFMLLIFTFSALPVCTLPMLLSSVSSCSFSGRTGKQLASLEYKQHSYGYCLSAFVVCSVTFVSLHPSRYVASSLSPVLGVLFPSFFVVTFFAFFRVTVLGMLEE